LKLVANNLYNSAGTTYVQGINGRNEAGIDSIMQTLHLIMSDVESVINDNDNSLYISDIEPMTSAEGSTEASSERQHFGLNVNSFVVAEANRRIIPLEEEEDHIQSSPAEIAGNAPPADNADCNGDCNGFSWLGMLDFEKNNPADEEEIAMVLSEEMRSVISQGNGGSVSSGVSRFSKRMEEAEI